MELEPGTSQSFVRVARIGKPHGIRGEVTVELFTDAPEIRFSEGKSLEVGATGVSLFQRLTVEKARWNKKILLLKFNEFSDRNTAEAMRNIELYARVEPRAEGDESWYSADLVGFSVFLDELSADKIGHVAGLITGAAQDLLEVRLTDGRDVLIPFVEEIVPKISEDQQTLLVKPPPGLLELNQD